MKAVYAVGVIVSVLIASTSAGLFDPPPANSRKAREAVPTAADTGSFSESKYYLRFLGTPDASADSPEPAAMPPSAENIIREYKPNIVLPSFVPK